MKTASFRWFSFHFTRGAWSRLRYQLISAELEVNFFVGKELEYRNRFASRIRSSVRPRVRIEPSTHPCCWPFPTFAQSMIVICETPASNLQTSSRLYYFFFPGKHSYYRPSNTSLYRHSTSGNLHKTFLHLLELARACSISSKQKSTKSSKSSKAT
jgi:hypothetical protein